MREILLQHLRFLVSLFIGFLFMVVFMAPVLAAPAHKAALKSADGEATSATICSPSQVKAGNSACKRPDQFSVGLWLYVDPQKIENLLEPYEVQAVAQAGDDVTWYIYVGGLCTLLYVDEAKTSVSGFNVGCINGQSFQSAVDSILKKQSWSVANTKYFVGLELGPAAISALNEGGAEAAQQAAYAINCTFYGRNCPSTNSSNALSPVNAKAATKDNAGSYSFSGIVVDAEGGISQAAAQQFLETLSANMPNSQMLNIYAGSPGKISADSSGKLHYVNQYWTAVNRGSNITCSADNPCQMGVMIPSIYGTPITYGTVPVSNVPEMGQNSYFNSGVEYFPYEMRLIDNLSNNVRGQPAYSQPPVATMENIQVVNGDGKPLGSYPPPYGYYQPGLVASGSTYDSASYVSYDSTAAVDKLLSGTDYWGGFAAGDETDTPIKMPWYIVSCGENCNVYRQDEIDAATNKRYNLEQVVNQYICTQLNAISYIYSGGGVLNLAGSEGNNWKDVSDLAYCGIDQIGSTKHNPLTFGWLLWQGKPPEAGVKWPKAHSVIYPFVQQGYGTLSGVSLYVISNLTADKIVNECDNNYPNNTKACNALIPSVGTIHTSAWTLFLKWLSANSGSAPTQYLLEQEVNNN